MPQPDPTKRLTSPAGGWQAFASKVEAQPPRLRRGKGSQAHLAACRETDFHSARAAPRCSVIRKGGSRCGCPAIRGAKRCYWHGGLLEVPDHPGNRAQVEKYHARAAKARARNQLYSLPKHARIQATALAIAGGAGRNWHIILQGAQAILQDDGGLALRRWIKEHNLT